MRVFLAAIFVVSCIIFTVGLLSDKINHVSPILFGLGMALLFFVLLVIAVVIFNSPLTLRRRFMSAEAQIKDLEEHGLLTRTEFNAVRAFQVEEFEDEGLHYFIELEGGSVLYLSGQYLYDYDTVEADDEDARLRTFPCSQFAIRRHRDDGFVVDILCQGRLLETECVAPAFQREDYRKGKVPEDGDINTGESFDELRRRIGQAH